MTIRTYRSSDVEAEIEPIVVSSQARGTGIGHRLPEHAVERAKRLGLMCLGDSFPGQWREGPELLGNEFDH